ncbi:MAG: branched-chain amino acid ABC transporter permease [Clostridiales bacterium]|mgnify:CR=1 FL=1|nr:branched-chain amino acid ABC transporter permease [Clostridiales bacterium]
MGNYITTVAVNIAVFSLLALSLNIIIGYAGQSMMGHAAFFGIGAYTAAILTNKGISFWLALLASLIVSGALGAILGIISLRLRDDFLAITTIGINFVMVALFQNMKFFGGSLGMAVKPLTMFGKKATPMHFLIMLLILIFLVCMLIRKMNSSWFGLALASLRGDEGAAQSFGVNTNQYKILAFIIGTSIAGLTGGVYAHRMTFIFSSSFAFIVSISIISMVVVGGVGTIRGPLVGAILLGAAPELLRFADDYRMILYGGVIVLMMRFQPQGLLGENSFLMNKFNQYINPLLKRKGGEFNA